MAILSPIGLKIGLHTTLDRNDGQNKLEVYISKNMARMANKWLKISSAATFGQSLSGHNSTIFYPIWTFDHTKMISSSRRVEWWKDLSYISFRLEFDILSHFLPPVATWTTLCTRVQNYPEGVGTCPTYQPQLIYENWCSGKNHYYAPLNWHTDVCL